MITPSGGLVYHARALRGLDLWFPTRRLVSCWLENWLLSCKPEHLIVFGPSAGYLFEPGSFLPAGLKHLTLVEPDPLAKPLFHLRHIRAKWYHPGPQPRVTWHPSSKLLPHTSRRETDFADFLSEASGSNPHKTAVFFSGLLGQLEFHRKSFRRDEFLARKIFATSLKPFSWASLHDLESKALARTERKGLLSLTLKDDPSNRLPFELPAEALQNQTLRIEWLEAQLKSANSAATWIDHGTEWLGPTRAAALWFLNKRQLQVLGFTTSS